MNEMSHSVHGIPRISVVIPTYQRREPLRRLLAALAQQSLPASAFEVIVAVDGSTDGTVELLHELGPSFALQVVSGPNRGRAAACNRAILAARAPLTVILDDDMEPSPMLLAEHLAAHAEGVPRAVVGAAPVAYDEHASIATARIAAKFARLGKLLATPGRAVHYREFYSGNVSLPTSVLRDVGGFDAAFAVYGHEDTDLAWRLTRSGVALAYCAQALATQHYQKDLAAMARDTINKGRTAVQLAQKFPETLPDLRLHMYSTGSRKWRLLRGLLLACAPLVPRVPDLLVGLVALLTRLHPDRLDLAVDLVLDYCFWAGALPALRSARAAGVNLPVHT